MPYSHFHDWSFHTHRRRPKGGNHWRAVRRRQRPWRIGALVLLVAVIIGTAAVLSVRNDVHTRIMFTLQQGMITPAPTPIDVDEPTERVVAITPSVKLSATAIRTPELVAARQLLLLYSRQQLLQRQKRGNSHCWEHRLSTWSMHGGTETTRTRCETSRVRSMK